MVYLPLVACAPQLHCFAMVSAWNKTMQRQAAGAHFYVFYLQGFSLSETPACGQLLRMCVHISCISNRNPTTINNSFVFGILQTITWHMPILTCMHMFWEQILEPDTKLISSLYTSLVSFRNGVFFKPTWHVKCIRMGMSSCKSKWFAGELSPIQLKVPDLDWLTLINGNLIPHTVDRVGGSKK